MIATPTPLVSVIMPAHDAAATIAAAIGSVMAQGFADWELLVADDASQDGTVGLIEDHARRDPRVGLIRSPDRLPAGAAVARNRALEAARGRFIAFLDADDLWLPGKLERQIAFMRDTGAALSCTGYLRRTAGRPDRPVRPPSVISEGRLLHGNCIGCLTAVYDTARLGKRPMPPIRRRHDYALWIEIVRDSGPARGLDLPLAVHVRRKGSLSSGRLGAVADTWRMYRDIAGLSRARSAECLAAHLLRRVFS